MSARVRRRRCGQRRGRSPLFAEACVVRACVCARARASRLRSRSLTAGLLRTRQGAMPYGREPQRQDDLYGNYKTTLCEQWASEGRCKLGEACSFAHGEGELREKRRGLSERELFRAEQMTRSRVCRFWQQTGSCPNGAACLFAHGQEALAKRQAAAFLNAADGGGEGGGGEGGGANGDGLVCLCLKPYSGCRLWPIASGTTTITHAVRPGQSSGVGHCTSTLLGSLSQVRAAVHATACVSARTAACTAAALLSPSAHVGAACPRSRLSCAPPSFMRIHGRPTSRCASTGRRT
jgi:hypothetical protein